MNDETKAGLAEKVIEAVKEAEAEEWHNPSVGKADELLTDLKKLARKHNITLDSALRLVVIRLKLLDVTTIPSVTAAEIDIKECDWGRAARE